MKVLHISHSDGKSGAGIAASRIHEALYNNKNLDKSNLQVNRKFNNIPNTFYKKTIFQKGLIFIKIYVERLLIKLINYRDMNFHSISSFPSKFDSRINKSDFEIVNLHWVQHEMISIEAIGRIKKPIVWTLHDAWAFLSTNHYPKNNFKNDASNSYKNKIIFSYFIDQWCLRRKKKYWKEKMQIVCPSNWLAKQAISSDLMKDWEVSVIPNPLNISIFKPLEKKSARKLLNIPTDKKKLLAFGAIDGVMDIRKGGDLLLKTIENLYELNKDFSLITFGKSCAIFKDKDFNIISYDQGFISKEEKLAIIYSAADILIMPSRIESFGQVASESMACGTPVIGFNTTGIKDIIDDDINGFLINNFDCYEMASKTNFLLNNENLIKNFQIKCREKALKKWSYEVVSDQYIKLYKSMKKK